VLHHNVRQWMGRSSDISGVGARVLQFGEGYRHRKGAKGQTAILSVDSASTRGNLAALEVSRADIVLIMTFPLH
jgi:hypothetical protein